jgi:hypothetical protein
VPESGVPQWVPLELFHYISFNYLFGSVPRNPSNITPALSKVFVTLNGRKTPISFEHNAPDAREANAIVKTD